MATWAVSAGNTSSVNLIRTEANGGTVDIGCELNGSGVAAHETWTAGVPAGPVPEVGKSIDLFPVC